MEYIPAPAIADVLREQLDYLIDHLGPCQNLTECLECQRMIRVTAELISPFQPIGITAVYSCLTGISPSTDGGKI